ncbi:hypothetical protein SLS62_010402 [Diatrype stigma]|uniref:Uncharacterized protein n=1 Tax=Diatrype stigma TaxID=117547 RepID=A0AAN9YIE1_9PEZI
MNTSDDDDGGRSSFGEYNDDSSVASPSFHHSRWPYISPEAQRAVEKRFFEDGATIPFDKLLAGTFSLPRPFFFSEGRRVMFILRHVVAAAHGSDRRLTAEEVDAVSKHAAHSVSRHVWIEPIAITGAAAATVNGRRTFRFPFFQPKPSYFDPAVFPARSFPLFRGIKATAHWHFVRFLAYYPFTFVASFALFESMSAMTFGVRLQRDPCLNALMQDTRAAIRRNIKTPGPPGASQPSSIERQAGYSGSPLPPVPQPQSYPRSQTVGNDTASAPEPPQWDTAQAPAQEPKGSTPPAYPAENPSWDADPFEDDASPVSPAARRAEAAARQQSSGGVSSWDRIRQQAQSGSGASGSFAKGDSSGRESGWAQLRQDKAPNTAEGARGTEQFSYSKQDEEKERRNYEKDQAQKEFDALLDAERRGESSTRGRR